MASKSAPPLRGVRALLCSKVASIMGVVRKFLQQLVKITALFSKSVDSYSVNSVKYFTTQRSDLPHAISRNRDIRVRRQALAAARRGGGGKHRAEGIVGMRARRRGRCPLHPRSIFAKMKLERAALPVALGRMLLRGRRSILVVRDIGGAPRHRISATAQGLGERSRTSAINAPAKADSAVSCHVTRLQPQADQGRAQRKPPTPTVRFSGRLAQSRAATAAGDLDSRGAVVNVRRGN